MIPGRFVADYPERCLSLLQMLEPMARGKHLLPSFSLLVATAIFVIPYERMRERHPLNPKGTITDLDTALRRLEKKENFCSAPFWQGQHCGNWRFSRIVKDHNDTHRWIDENGLHPMAANAGNSITAQKAGRVLRVIRNALSHGNVVYLNADGREQEGTPARYLGFLSRYEDSEEQRRDAETYRLVVTTDEDFLRFVKGWGMWISKFRRDLRLSEAA